MKRDVPDVPAEKLGQEPEATPPLEEAVPYDPAARLPGKWEGKRRDGKPGPAAYDELIMPRR